MCSPLKLKLGLIDAIADGGVAVNSAIRAIQIKNRGINGFTRAQAKIAALGREAKLYKRLLTLKLLRL
jgi:hypothetical protein